MRRLISIGGRPVALVADDDELWDEMSPLFVGCPDVSGHPDPELVIARRRAEIVTPPRPADVLVQTSEYWFEADGAVARFDGAVCGRRHGRTVEVGGTTPRGVEPYRAFRLAAQVPLADALTLVDRFVIHAATIVRDGEAVLIVGDSGAGKSTFVHAAGVSGWHVQSDDLSILSDDEPPVVWGFPKPLHVPADVLGGPSPGGQMLPDDERERHSLSPPALLGAPSVVRGVVTVQHAEREGWFRPAPQSSQRVEDLVLSFLVAPIPRALPPIFQVASRLARMPAVDFAHDATPARRVAAVARFLDGWLAD